MPLLLWDLLALPASFPTFICQSPSSFVFPSFLLVTFIFIYLFFYPTAGVDKCAWKTRAILHLLSEGALCVQRKLVNIPVVLTLQIWSSLLQNMEGFQVHLGVTSEILSRVSPMSWAFWVEGRGRANRLDARRLQTDRLENKSTCTHWQVALQDRYRFLFYRFIILAMVKNEVLTLRLDGSGFNTEIPDNAHLCFSWSVQFSGNQRWRWRRKKWVLETK